MTRATSDRMSIAWRAMSSVTPEIAAAESPMIVPRNVRRHDETGWGKFEAHNWGEFDADHNCSLIPVQRLRTTLLVGRDRWDGQAHLRSQIRGRVSVDFEPRSWRVFSRIASSMRPDRRGHSRG